MGYTTSVRSICENLTGRTESVGYDEAKAVIAEAIPLVFDFEFPVHDEEYRNVLCTKILKHYYMREIGAETVAQWKFWLDARLNEIMPYYNQLYKSALLEFNPLYDVDVKTTRTGSTDGSTDVTDNTTGKDTKTTARDSTTTGESTGTNTSTTTHDNQNVNLFADTPQGALDGFVESTYLTDARKITDSGSDNVTDNSTNEQEVTVNENVTDNVDRTMTKTGKTVATTTEEYLETVQGKHGGTSYAKMLQDYRKTFINIDMMVIDDLADLFFNLW